MKHCRECGERFLVDQKFCSLCGNKVINKQKAESNNNLSHKETKRGFNRRLGISLIIILIVAITYIVVQAKGSSYDSVETYDEVEEPEPYEKGHVAEEEDNELVMDLEKETDTRDMLKEDLTWMNENNSDIANDNMVLLKTTEKEVLGPTISYSLLVEDDEFTTKPELHVSFNGNRYSVVLGWFPPNTHGVNVLSLNDKEWDNETYIFPEYDLFYDFIEIDESSHIFNHNTVWQVTAADLSGNGVLELILLAYYWDYNVGAVEKVINVYEYVEGNEQKPFELAVHLRGNNATHKTDQIMYFTKGQEFIHDSYGLDLIEAFYEDGEWYVSEENWLHQNTKAQPFHFDSNFKPVKGGE